MPGKIVLELSPEHARVVQDACEALMRLKLGQTAFLTELLIGWPITDEKKLDKMLLRTEIARDVLETYLTIVLGKEPGYPGPKGVKDEIESLAYEVYGSIRHAIWEHDNPNGENGWSVCSREPLHESGKPMPIVKVVD